MSVATARRPPTRRPTEFLDWADRAACAGKVGFTEWALPESDKVCRVCPVRRDCYKARLTPRQIQAMP